MKKYLYLITIIVVVVWSIFLRQPKTGDEKNGQTALTQMDISSDGAPAGVNRKTVRRNISQKKGKVDPEEVRKFIEAERTDPVLEWKQPIDFYGKVMDENEQPIALANVSFIWNDTSETGTTKATAATGPDGLFSLTGKRGKRLSVVVEKEGYYTPVASRTASFEYLRMGYSQVLTSVI